MKALKTGPTHRTNGFQVRWFGASALSALVPPGTESDVQRMIVGSARAGAASELNCVPLVQTRRRHSEPAGPIPPTGFCLPQRAPRSTTVASAASPLGLTPGG